jgi:hypothetical protein
MTGRKNGWMERGRMDEKLKGWKKGNNNKVRLKKRKAERMDVSL